MRCCSPADMAQTIGEAGTLQLDTEALEGLQEKVISDWRFVVPGLRHRGGFIGIHDRVTRLPIPSHISARPQTWLASSAESARTTNVLCRLAWTRSLLLPQ